jgi:uncharacterized membrane protein
MPIWLLVLQDRVRTLEKRTPQEGLPTNKADESRRTQREVSPAPVVAKAPKAVSPSSNASFEEKVGSHWFQWIGIAALLLALLFFLKWSFDRGLIGPMGRTLIGYALAAGAMVAGHLTRKKYGPWALTFTGGGAAAVYLVTWIAHQSYFLFPTGIAFGIYVLVTIVACALATKYDALGLAVMSVVGAFLVPVLANTYGNASQTLLYVLLLDIGVLGLSLSRRWRALNVASLFGTVVYEYVHLNAWDLPRNQGLLFIAIFFVLFALVSVLSTIIRKEQSEEGDVVVLVGNALFHFGLTLVWMNFVPGLREQYDAMAALLFAVLSFLFAATIYGKNPKDSGVVIASIGLTVFFSALTVPMHFGGPWVPLAWSIEGAFLLWVALQLKDARLQGFGWCVLGASYVSYFIREPGPLFLAPEGLYTFAAWMALIAGLASVGLGRDDYRGQRVIPVILVTFSVAALSFFCNLAQMFDLPALQRFLQAAFLVGGSGVVLWQAQKRWDAFTRDERMAFTVLGVGANVVTLSYLTGEFVRAVQDGRTLSGFESPTQVRRVGTSILWAVYAAASLGAGIALRSRALRLFGMILLLITAAKLTLVDFFALGTGARIIGFTILGILLVGASFVYQHKQDAIRSFLRT